MKPTEGRISFVGDTNVCQIGLPESELRRPCLKGNYWDILVFKMELMFDSMKYIWIMWPFL